ncbi:MAG: hypothetical protein WAM11_16175 [Cyanobium sp.]
MIDPQTSPPPPASPSPRSDPSADGIQTGAPRPDPVLCGHCGRTASNGISCQGICVADSGY